MAAGLLDHYVDFVAVLHLERLWCVVVFDPLAVKNEAALVIRQTLALAVGVHEFLQLRLLLDLKEDFGSILCLHFNV